MSHSNAVPSFQVVSISNVDSATTTIQWTPMVNASGYRVDLTSSKNCASTVISLNVDKTSLSFNPQSSTVNFAYACVYAVTPSGVVIAAAKNNPFPLQQVATPTSSTAATSSNGISSSANASSSSSTISKSLYSYLNLLVGDSTTSGCGRGTYGIGGLAINAALNLSYQIAVDGSDNIFISDGRRMQMIPSASGTYFGQAMTANYLYTIVGDPAALKPGNITSGTLASTQLITSGTGITSDSNGNVYLATEYFVYMIPKASGTYFGQAMTAGYVYAITNGGSGSSGISGPTSAAKLYFPAHIAVDTLGNLYIADKANNRVLMIAAVAGTYFGQTMSANYIYNIAGSSATTAGNAGAGGVLGTSALITTPTALSVDASGNVFFSDTTNTYTYMLAANTGTYFGQSMTSGYIYSLVSGTAVNALANDSSGNLYFGASAAIKMIPAANGTYFGQAMTTGTSYTLAGTGTRGCTVSGHAASTALLGGTINGLTVDSHNNVIMNQSSEKISVLPAANGSFYGQSMSSGNIYNLVGISIPTGYGFSAPGPRLSASLADPYSIALDSSNNLYICQNVNGNMLMVPASSGTYFGQVMVAQNYYRISSTGCGSIAVDPSGNVLFTSANGLYAVAASTGSFYGTAMTVGLTYQISGAGASQASGVALANVMLTSPWGVGIDATGNVYVSDTGYYRIIMIPAVTGNYFGQAMTANYAYTIAGGNGSGSTGFGALATSAQITPHGGNLAIDNAGNVFFPCANQILIVAAVTGTYFSQSMTAGYLYRLAGSATATAVYNSTPQNGILSTSVGLYDGSIFMGVATDHLGNVYFAEGGGNAIHMIPQVSGTYFNTTMTVGYLYTLNAHSPISGYSTTGTLTSAGYINHPESVAIDSSGNVIVCDSGNYAIRVITVPQ